MHNTAVLFYLFRQDGSDKIVAGHLTLQIQPTLNEGSQVPTYDPASFVAPDSLSHISIEGISAAREAGVKAGYYLAPSS